MTRRVIWLPNDGPHPLREAMAADHLRRLQLVEPKLGAASRRRGPKPTDHAVVALLGAIVAGAETCEAINTKVGRRPTWASKTARRAFARGLVTRTVRKAGKAKYFAFAVTLAGAALVEAAPERRAA